MRPWRASKRCHVLRRSGRRPGRPPISLADVDHGHRRDQAGGVDLVDALGCPRPCGRARRSACRVCSANDEQPVVEAVVAMVRKVSAVGTGAPGPHDRAPGRAAASGPRPASIPIIDSVLLLFRPSSEDAQVGQAGLHPGPIARAPRPPRSGSPMMHAAQQVAQRAEQHRVGLQRGERLAAASPAAAGCRSAALLGGHARRVAARRLRRLEAAARRRRGPAWMSAAERQVRVAARVAGLELQVGRFHLAPAEGRRDADACTRGCRCPTRPWTRPTRPAAGARRSCSDGQVSATSAGRCSSTPATNARPSSDSSRGRRRPRRTGGCATRRGTRG